jgi:flagellar basal body-associated protein FliL
MSERERDSADEGDAAPKRSQGPNLILMYSLIALALAAAIGFAWMIVAPFHHRH